MPLLQAVRERYLWLHKRLMKKLHEVVCFGRPEGGGKTAKSWNVSVSLTASIGSESADIISVPVVSSCHKVISAEIGGPDSGTVKSHDGYPRSPYAPGFQCRYVITVPAGRQAAATIEGNVALRPWDFAVLVDGNAASRLNFICNPERYNLLGVRGKDYIPVTQKKLDAAGGGLSLKSPSTTIVVDFCVHTFDKDLKNRKGFQITFTSVPKEADVGESGGSSPQFGDHVSKPQPEVLPQIEEVPRPPPPAAPKPGQISQTPSSSSCGRPQNPPSKSNRIVNGVEARENSWPWICSLQRKANAPLPPHICGCTVISERWIVTAGHCADIGEAYIKGHDEVIIGVEDLRQATSQHTFKIEQVFLHEAYNTDPQFTITNDIALMRLSRSVTFSNDVMPICLPDQTVHTKPFPNAATAINGRRICYVAGWGMLREKQASAEGGKIGFGSDQLQQVAIEIIPRTSCKLFLDAIGKKILNNAFCGGYDAGGKDSCQGDSGGPWCATTEMVSGRSSVLSRRERTLAVPKPEPQEFTRMSPCSGVGWSKKWSNMPCYLNENMSD
ncbi:putative Chymotrypsinogen A [Hypsibius exemplaris]|uniref:Chymotrypsinogen A n=1 Tax=Hypsibius exemplaris TaxID=2072580 RepID=A0A1W0WHY2_HYPEX|nr:putative Chymotrypsinogen A [Hypsibius exemplaris]